MFRNVEIHEHHTEEERKHRLELLNKGVDSGVNKSFKDRWAEINKTSAGRNAIDAWKRVSFNTAMTALDVAPVVGDLSEETLTALKVAKGFASNSSEWIDPTPDIGVAEAVGYDLATAPLEALTGGVLPSYGIKTVRQLHADIEKGNFSGSRATLGYLFTGNQRYYEELQADIPNLEKYKGVLSS